MPDYDTKYLAAAIVSQAMKDYINHPTMRLGVIRFFQSAWFSEISGDLNINLSRVFETMKKQAIKHDRARQNKRRTFNEH